MNFLNLLVQVRQQIIDRDYRALYAVWEKYGSIDYDDEFDVPVSWIKNRQQYSEAIQKLT